jgi:acyl-[acyl-carrier-protein] desaturase
LLDDCEMTEAVYLVAFAIVGRYREAQPGARDDVCCASASSETGGGTALYCRTCGRHDMQQPTELDLLRELEPIVAANLNRHLAVAQEWLPHEWIPWSRGRDFTTEGGGAWSPDQSLLPAPLRAAFEVNLLTEDNLPSYHYDWRFALAWTARGAPGSVAGPRKKRGTPRASATI